MILHTGWIETQVPTSATTPTQPQIEAALGWAPLIPPSPDVTNTYNNIDGPVRVYAESVKTFLNRMWRIWTFGNLCGNPSEPTQKTIDAVEESRYSSSDVEV